MVKVLHVASKCMHNFPPSDLTLPGNTPTMEYARCIPSWTHKNYHIQKFLKQSLKIGWSGFSGTFSINVP